MKWHGEEHLGDLANDAPAAARLLADAAVDAIAFACTTGSLYAGPRHDQRIISRIEDATGIPATTTTTALLEALMTLHIRSLAIVSPYEPWASDRVVRFLQKRALVVDGARALSVPDDELASFPPEDIANAVCEIDSPRVDAVFISCTAFRGVEALMLLGDTLGKPILSSNQVTYWKLARMTTQPWTLTNAGSAFLFNNTDD